MTDVARRGECPGCGCTPRLDGEGALERHKTPGGVRCPWAGKLPHRIIDPPRQVDTQGVVE